MRAIIVLLAAVFVSVSSSSYFKSLLDLRQEISPWVSPRIIEGQATSDGQFPYQVLIVVYSNGFKKPIVVGWCGGAIIADQWVVTTSHCLALCKDGSEFPVFYIEAGSVRAGQARQTTSVLSTDAYLHPDFDPDYFWNDIGLLKTKPFDFSTPFVQPIALVAAGTDSTMYEGLYITIAGFGYTSTSGPPSEQILFTHYLKVISLQSCQEKFAAGIVQDTVFCASDLSPPITATCYGDAGGPAAMEMSGVMTLVGLASFASKKGCDQAPQGFTDVAQYVKWIGKMMAKH
ncbi:collagenase-like [Phlebotomus argentipes]|uniref:collagenase-like n=1 Tax=Phlebotomus argentipes TaxID=94469 RepID=UPI00289328AE|nr:collagenase-like [Phlebotomus argentipes]